MYTDTKKSYEQIIQTSIINPQLSSLHLKLRIQKDRLVAWGLEWADSKADQINDIDGSLDRAGISDLVASIMSSIRELVDETEKIQPRSRSQHPGGYSDDKAGMLLSTTGQWTPANLARLEDIVKDITTSIDTLCDLSRSQQIMRQGFAGGEKEKLTALYPDSERTEKGASSSTSSTSVTQDEKPALQIQSSLISSTRINLGDLIYPTRTHQPATKPPSYNSTATDPGNRMFAFLKPSWQSEKAFHSVDRTQATPVLLDYYLEDRNHSRHGTLSPSQRYDDLVLSLQGSHNEGGNLYTGSLRIIGWLPDPFNSRYAFVYEIPRQTMSGVPTSFPTVNPTQSLLFYLQYSGEVDSSNVPCLEDRLRLALNLVTNVLHVHAKGLTHRNINSNNIVFVNESGVQDPESKPWKEGVIRKPLLVSWDQGDEDTFTSDPETLMSSIYRHPGIERGQRSRYRPAHDIYSLGLILLEVGLWMPLNKLWKTKYSRLDFMARLQTIYAKKLSAKCGRAYMGAVEYCLRAVSKDQDVRTSRRPTSGDRQAKVQTDYYWSVFKPLERCCMMDDLDEPKVMPAPSSPTRRPEVSMIEQRSPALDNDQHQSVARPTATLKVESSETAPCDTWTAFSPLLPGNKIETCVWSHTVSHEIRQYFDTMMAPKLNRMFAKAIDRWESFEIYVCMAGVTPDLAKPTLLMVCKSLAKAWKILEYVNKEKEMFQLYVAPGQLTRSKGKKKRTKKSKIAGISRDEPGRQPSRYQQKPTCGASIGCFVDEQHSEAVTFGGVVLVDGEPHGMSVHHMLEDPGGSGDDLSSFGGIESEDPLFMIDEFSASLNALDVSNYDVEEFEEFDMGDFPGTNTGEGGHIIVTQPALDDVDPGYFSNEEEMSDDHLVIHGLGTVHASSGLRRLSFDNVAHEVDWALFKLHDDRKPVMNTLEGGIQHCKKAAQAFYPSQVLKADALGDLRVHAFGSTSGLETGTILPAMQMTKMPGRIYASPVWRVKGNFGVGGDSGAWVIDNATGGVCAHVTAYSEAMEYATIAPMEVLLHDMEQTLGTNIALPSGEQTTLRTYKQQMVDFDGTQAIKLADKDRRPSLASDYGSGSEADTQSIQGHSPPQSPVLATSPQPFIRRISTLSLNSVAEQWEQQTQAKQESMDRKPKGCKALGETVLVTEEVQARC